MSSKDSGNLEKSLYAEKSISEAGGLVIMGDKHQPVPTFEEVLLPTDLKKKKKNLNSLWIFGLFTSYKNAQPFWNWGCSCITLNDPKNTFLRIKNLYVCDAFVVQHWKGTNCQWRTYDSSISRCTSSEPLIWQDHVTLELLCGCRSRIHHESAPVFWGTAELQMQMLTPFPC